MLAPVEAVRLVASDGTELSAVHLRAAGGHSKGTVVQFHGNAGNITSHQKSVTWLTERGYDLLLFDYRGYGASDGFPTPEGVHLDALAAIDYANTELPRLAERDVVLLGQSLGGAILLRALGDRPAQPRVRYVVIESSFHSYQEMAASVTFRVPALFLLGGVAYGLVSDAWAPAPYVAHLAPTPVLFVHGLRDEVVAPAFSAALFSLAEAPRSLLVLPDAGHQGPMTQTSEAYRAAYLQVIENEDSTRCPEVNVEEFVCEPLTAPAPLDSR